MFSSGQVRKVFMYLCALPSLLWEYTWRAPGLLWRHLKAVSPDWARSVKLSLKKLQAWIRLWWKWIMLPMVGVIFYFVFLLLNIFGGLPGLIFLYDRYLPPSSDPFKDFLPLTSKYPGLDKAFLENVLSLPLNPARYDALLREVEANASRLTPESRASLHRLRAYYYLRKPHERDEKEVQELLTAAKIAPDDPFVFDELSFAYTTQEKYAEALQYLELAKAKARNRPDLAAWSAELECRSADIYFIQHDFLRAQDALRSCLAAPKFQAIPFLGYLRAEMLAAILNTQGRFSEAEQVLRKATSGASDVFASTAEAMGITELFLKKYDAAEQWLSKALHDYSFQYISTLSNPSWLEDYTRGNANMILLYVIQGRSDPIPKYLHRIEVALGRAVPDQCLPGTTEILLQAALIAINHQNEVLFRKLWDFAKISAGNAEICLGRNSPLLLGTFLTMRIPECGDDICIKRRSGEAIAAFDKVPYLSDKFVGVRDIAKKWSTDIKNKEPQATQPD